jgi:hypothetical protein
VYLIHVSQLYNGIFRDVQCLPVHAAVDQLTVLVSPCPPGVVPQPTPVGLLLIADDFRNRLCIENDNFRKRILSLGVRLVYSFFLTRAIFNNDNFLIGLSQFTFEHVQI